MNRPPSSSPGNVGGHGHPEALPTFAAFRDGLCGCFLRRDDFDASTTDPDGALMRREAGGLHFGCHYDHAVNGGKGRIVLKVLVPPADVTENQPPSVPASGGGPKLLRTRADRQAPDPTSPVHPTAGPSHCHPDADRRGLAPLSTTAAEAGGAHDPRGAPGELVHGT